MSKVTVRADVLLNGEKFEDFGVPVKIPRGMKIITVRNGEKKLTTKHVINVVLDYPLDGNYVKQFKRAGGWTLNQIIEAIRESYKIVYEHPKLFGVWGHGIGDLMIEIISVSSDGHTVTTHIGS